ncbi:MAG: phosphate/phosphite/phosphonate ABC transporter substrate-binding protein [Syntrophobacteraceae bacterium]|nr:phosphate/phosphite/phosphonate ABC transporter substrate-binding protein [Syntrophobacteraceae bacterium]
MSGDARSSDAGYPLFRFALASSMIAEVNENDAKAALKLWARVIVADRGIPVDPETRILNGTEAITNAMRSKLFDALGLSTAEYWTLGEEVLTAPLVLAVNEGRITEEYVLLVHRESGIQRIGDLRGRSLLFFQNPRTGLAPAWLDVLLVKSGFVGTAEFFGRVTQTNKIAQSVLPVFFRKSDACVVTRRGFRTMSELNPQLAQQLKVVASSPEFVPSLFCFRKDYEGPSKDKILEEMHKIDETPAGQQVLTIFQCEKLEVHPISCLKSAFELLNDHRRLLPTVTGAKAGTTQPKLYQAKE